MLKNIFPLRENLHSYNISSSLYQGDFGNLKIRVPVSLIDIKRLNRLDMLTFLQEMHDLAANWTYI